MQQRVHQLLGSIRSYSTLFDRKRYGINITVGISFFLALLLARVVWVFWLPGFTGLFHSPFFNFYFSGFVVDIVISFAFVITSHFISNSYVLAVVYALVFALVRAGARTIQPVFYFPIWELMRLPLAFDVQYILEDILFGLFFMSCLMMAIKIWGVKLWSLIAGAVSSYLVFHLLMYFLSISLISHSLLISSMPIAINIANSVIFGALLYGGLYLHFLQRR